MTDVQGMTRAEGEALVDYLKNVSADEWGTQTVCDPWTVRHLVAHLTALSNQTLPNFARRMITTGFNFQKVVDGDLQKYLGEPDAMIDKLASSIESPTTPGMLNDIALGEFMCHGEDIRRAFGDRGDHPSSHVSALGPVYSKTGKPLNGKVRTKGLSLRATDGDFAWGEGPEVAGPGIDLILATTGRVEALETCEGDGVEVLRSRC
ncbi:MAG: maleylpyruvate isomerase family mycothiol-dependent enzyme [Acidimicrobiales bacterium]